MRVETTTGKSKFGLPTTTRLEWFDSFSEFISSGKEYQEGGKKHSELTDTSNEDDWAGNGDTWDHCFDMAVNGWKEGEQLAMPLVEQALATLEREVERPHFEAQWLLTGAEVDVGRYLQGIPECMIEYEPTTVSRVGKVVTLCASFIYSGGLSATSVVKRGAAITALAMALEECQHSTEIWIDHTTTQGGHTVTTKVLVKGVNDSISPAKLAFALAHPSILRRFMFSHEHTWPKEVQKQQHVGSGYGMPTNPVENLPEGTIYLPCLSSSRDIPDADRFIVEKIRELGLAE